MVSILKLGRVRFRTVYFSCLIGSLIVFSWPLTFAVIIFIFGYSGEFMSGEAFKLVYDDWLLQVPLSLVILTWLTTIICTFGLLESAKWWQCKFVAIAILQALSFWIFGHFVRPISFWHGYYSLNATASWEFITVNSFLTMAVIAWSRVWKSRRSVN